MGNGGYVAGRLAELLCEGPDPLQPTDVVELTLRAPIPLDTPMTVTRTGRSVSIHHGETLIALGGPAELEPFDIPTPPSFEEALALQPTSASFKRTFNPMLNEERLGAHPICFCCGADIEPGAGLHVYSAPVPGTHTVVAAAWQCPPAYAVDGLLPANVIWTALDCPGQFAWYENTGAGALLGRITGRIVAPVPADQRFVVLGWTMEQDGRKWLAGTALFNDTGGLLAYAKAVWFPFVRKPDPA